MNIAAWLYGLGLRQCQHAFCDNAIDASVLRELTAGDGQVVHICGEHGVISSGSANRRVSRCELGDYATWNFRHPQRLSRPPTPILLVDSANLSLDRAAGMHGGRGSQFEDHARQARASSNASPKRFYRRQNSPHTASIMRRERNLLCYPPSVGGP